MGLLDRLLGRTDDRSRRDSGYRTRNRDDSYGRVGAGRDPDEAAVERYRYMLRTAPPEAIEQAHAEAFAKLTPEQRRQVLDEVGREVPDAERARSDDPAALARMATRAEMRRPGTMERALGRPGGGMGGGMGGGIGLGGMIAGGLLASVAGAFIGTAIAEQFFDESGGEDAGGEDAQAAEGDPGAEAGAEDPGAGDAGGDFGGGDFGGDFGGGDFGGF